MRRLILIVLAVLLAPVALAQQAEATLNSPITRTSEAKYKLNSVRFTRQGATAYLELAVQDSSNFDTRGISLTFATTCGSDNCGCPQVPSTTPTTDALLNAMGNSAANETGTASRRMLFRVMTYLTTTTGCITGVTLVP